jgi:ribonucleoside-diphosphate reductase alpha chain
VREHLPDRRRNITRKAKVAGFTLHYTVGFYPDGRIGELFVDVAKQGTAIRNWASATAMLVSLLLQYGAPLSEVISALKDVETSDLTEVVGHESVLTASGVLDFIAKALEADYVTI